MEKNKEKQMAISLGKETVSKTSKTEKDNLSDRIGQMLSNTIRKIVWGNLYQEEQDISSEGINWEKDHGID